MVDGQAGKGDKPRPVDPKKWDEAEIWITLEELKKELEIEDEQ